jgi:exopolysaccharide biosynthesis protein
MQLHFAVIDLTNPKVSLHVSPAGPDPDGEGKWQTMLMPPSDIAKREGFELAVNGDFFVIPTAAELQASGRTPGYTGGMWASVQGPAVSKGKAWATSAKKRPCLVVRKSGVVMEMLDKPGPEDLHVVAGNVLLVENGKAVQHANQAKHPRTVIGLDEKRTKLTIIVIDGRQAGTSEGMSYAELSKELIAAGCFTAMNLDGGGSSVMVLRKGEKHEIKNKPSNGKERPVGNVLGVDVAD